MKNSYVSGDLAGLLLSWLDAEGLPAPAVRRVLDAHPPHSRMPMTQWWSLLESIRTLRPGEPGLGVSIGRHVRPHHSGVLGYLVMSCDTLGEALLRFQRYQLLLHNHSEVALGVRPDRVRLSWDVRQGRSTQLSDEVFLSGLISYMQQISGRPTLRPLGIRFNHPPPAPVAAYERLFGCPVRFKAKRVALDLAPQTLAVAVDTRDPHLRALLEKQAAALAEQAGTAGGLLARLGQVLLLTLPEARASQDECARRLHLSTRTLQRRLAEQGTSFRAQLRSTREQLARMYLADPALSIGEVAFLLGYAEPAVFTRACTRWFGCSPRGWRQGRRPTSP